jgi:hypothetical protein
MKMKHAPVIFKGFIGGLLGLFLLAGCSNTLLQPSRTADEPPAVVPPAEAGTGRLTISLTGTGVSGGERTLFPNTPGSFSKYELVFTPEGGQDGVSPVIFTEGASYSLTLPTGDWTITARGYVSIQGVPDITNGDYVAARGSKTVTVSAAPANISIDLRGGIDAGTGVFRYDIAIPGGLDSATLEILSLTGSLVKSVNLQSAASGSWALNSGYYLLKVSRVKGGKTTVRAEVVHIYEGWTTEAAGPDYDFTGLDSVAEILGLLSAQPANTASSPYTLVLGGDFDLERDFLKDGDPLGLLYEALDGKYVSLDLSACGGDIPGVSYYTADGRPNKDKIVSVTLPDTLTTIGDYAFYGWTSLAALDLPDNLTSIGQSVFEGSSIVSIDLPDAITTIGDYAFKNCASLDSIDLPDNLTAIGQYAFEGCGSLTAIALPDSLTTIPGYAFYNCASLAAITLPDNLTTIGQNAFNGCISLEAITLPDAITTIGNAAFGGCSSLVSIDLPDSLTTIGEFAFSGCTSLVSIDLPDSCTTIGRDAFSYCSSLLIVDLPDSITAIHRFAFGATALKLVISRNSTPPVLYYNGYSPFHDTPALQSIYVPDESVDAYKSAWGDYAGKIKPLSELPPSTGGSAGLQISFTGPVNNDITLDGGGFKLSKSDSGYSSINISVENPGDYASFRWLVDGADLAGETGGSVTLDAANHNAGTHWLTVIAEKAGVPYSRAFVFAVVN